MAKRIITALIFVLAVFALGAWITGLTGWQFYMFVFVGPIVASIGAMIGMCICHVVSAFYDWLENIT